MSFGFLVINVCAHGEYCETPYIIHKHVSVASATIHHGGIQEYKQYTNSCTKCIFKTTRCYSWYIKRSLP